MAPDAEPAPGGGPPYDVVGADAISPLLERATFPASKERLLEEVGDFEIPVSRERTRRLSEILDEVAPEEFADAHAVTLAVERAWDDVAQLQGERGGRHRQGDDTSQRPPRTPKEEGGMPRSRDRKTNNADPRAARGK